MQGGAVFTDTYDLPVNNDTTATASNLGTYNIIPCTSVAPIVSSATFWRAGLPNPANDTDHYRVQLGGQLAYTLTVAAQTPSDLRFFLQVVDPIGNVIYSQPDLQSHSAKFYNLNAGVYGLQLRASNASTIVGTESKTYLVTLCSSPDLITPTPTNTTIPATVTPIPGNVPDSYEPNDNIPEASVPAGMRGTASFISVGTSIPNLSFFPYTDRTGDMADWFQFYGRAGSIYQINTANVQPGVETVLFVYQPDGTTLVAPLSGTTNPNNRIVAGQRGSQVTFQAVTDGLHWIQVVNTDPSPRVPGQTYAAVRRRNPDRHGNPRSVAHARPVAHALPGRRGSF